MTARTLQFSPRWLRPTVWGTVALLLLGSGYIVYGAQENTKRSAENTKLTAENFSTHTNAVKAYRSLLATIAAAKEKGVDTAAFEEEAKSISALLIAEDYDAVTLAITTQVAALTEQLANTEAAQAAAEAEAKKYGTLSLTIANGAGAAVSAQPTEGSPVTGTANDQGIVEMKLLTGTYVLTITKSGFQTATVPDITIVSKETATKSAVLTATPVVSIATPKATAKATATPTATPTTTPSSSTEHSSYRRSTVSTSRGAFTADIMEFELGPGKIKVLTDTASDSDCSNDCPTLSIKGYADRYNGVVGAMNGTYFCPADYASCSSEVGSFFWKIKNPRINTMINASNGLGENDGFLTFNSSGTATYYNTWSSAPSVYAGINHKPSVVKNGAYNVDENTLDEKQRTSKITRGGIGLKGQTLFAVIVQSATVMDLGAVMEALDTDVALNLDGGGSAAMWYNGAYKRGPGRSVPNALVFVQQ
ncbi:MAG: phosphodiester glycosidase family protein [Candidatus Paceibacterota bacterium]